MWYVIHSKDVPDSLDKRLRTRPEHLKRLNDLLNQGRLYVAGPIPAIDNEDPGPNGYLGSLIIAEFETIEDAQQWAQEDPYVIAGVYASFSVQPFRKVLP